MIENQAFYHNNVTLFLRNTGTTTVTLVSYYVQDLNGNQYSRLSWIGAPIIGPTGLGQAQVQIQPQCSSSTCPLTGSAFTFQRGNSYNIIVVTSRNNQFTFTLLW